MTDKGKAIAREVTNCWSRNFNEGVIEMVRNSPTAPGPLYVREGESSKGKRKFAEIQYSPSANASDEELEFDAHTAAKSPATSISPEEFSQEEIKQSFCQVWRETKDCIETLSGYIIASFQISFGIDSFIDRVYPDTYFIEPGHESYAVQAQLYKVLLRSFEDESFGTSAAAHESNKEFSPADQRKVRPARFYQYFKSNSESTDIDYISWFENRVVSFFGTFRTYMPSAISFPSTVVGVPGERLLQELGGPDLVSSFRAAARACWRLQTLAFSSEPPAARLKVKEGDVYEETSMVPVVDVHEDEFDGDRGDLTVSFMVAPGFFCKLEEPLVRAEVYLIAVAPDHEFSSSPEPDPDP